jgi:hypothetical protein
MTDQTDTTTPRITTAEQIRWQRDAAGVLAKLLELAAKRGLPAIDRSVRHTGALPQAAQAPGRAKWDGRCRGRDRVPVRRPDHRPRDMAQ